MANAYAVDDLLEFLTHASERGLMPAATATALSVAVRNVFGVLSDAERNDLSTIDLAEVTRRFNTKRARDFNPSSLKEYGRRVRRAVDLFERWSDDPANFSIKTRATKAGGRKPRDGGLTVKARDRDPDEGDDSPPMQSGGYSSSVPLRTDWVVTVANIPSDLTAAEADRLARFVRMLPVE